MHHDVFIGQVQRRGQLPSGGDAERVTRATLETLGERIPEGLAENVAAQLPREIGEHLRRTVVMGGEGTGERFDQQAFITRMSVRAGEDEPRATYLSRVVLEVVDEATEGQVMDKVRDSVPDDIGSLIESGSQGEMSS